MPNISISFETSEQIITLLPKHRTKCVCIADIVIIQCIVVCIGAVSILGCFWTPEHSTNDWVKLTRIMYLYDAVACGYTVKKARAIANLQLSNETHSLDVLPIKWLPVITSVSARLSGATRRYMHFSITFHIFWSILALIFRFIIKKSTDTHVLKITLYVFFYSCVFIICFDLSMAVVYVTHIKQSLTKGMILRHSGWSNELKLDNYEDFAGWLPIAASACWLRGIFFFMLNLYFCRVIMFIRRRMVKRALFQKLYKEHYQPFPEAKEVASANTDVLVCRVGEEGPMGQLDNLFKRRSIIN